MGDPLQTEEGLLKCQEAPRGWGRLRKLRCGQNLGSLSTDAEQKYGGRVWWKEKRAALLCAGKRETVGYCLKNTAPLSRDEGEVL